MVITCESRYATRAQDSFPSRIAVCCSLILLPPIPLPTIIAPHFALCGHWKEVSPITGLTWEGLVEWSLRPEIHDEQPLSARHCAVAGGRCVRPVDAAAGLAVGQVLLPAQAWAEQECHLRVRARIGRGRLDPVQTRLLPLWNHLS